MFKTKVAKEVIKGQKTIAEIASEYSVHPTQIKSWRDRTNTAIEQNLMDRIDKIYTIKCNALTYCLLDIDE